MFKIYSVLDFGHLKFGFVSDFGFRASDLLQLHPNLTTNDFIALFSWAWERASLAGRRDAPGHSLLPVYAEP